MTECKWSKKEKFLEFNYYETSCGGNFEFLEGNPKDNEFKYCPYCGGLLIDITEEEKKNEEKTSL